MASWFCGNGNACNAYSPELVQTIGYEPLKITLHKNDERMYSMYRDSEKVLRTISDFNPKNTNKMVTLNKGSHLFHASSFDRNLGWAERFGEEIKLPMRPVSYFAITRDSAIATLYARKQALELKNNKPELGFVIEFEISENIKLYNTAIPNRRNVSGPIYQKFDLIGPLCRKKELPGNGVVGFFLQELVEDIKTNHLSSSIFADFYMGMCELCLKDASMLNPVRVHLVDLNKQNRSDLPSVLADSYNIIKNCSKDQMVYLRNPSKYGDFNYYSDPYYCKNKHGVNDPKQWLAENADKINFNNYVEDTRDFPSQPQNIDVAYINKWAAENGVKSGGKGVKSKVCILGRNRNIVLRGKTKYVIYMKVLIKLTDAIKLDKKKVVSGGK
jgi:hypothetical protein